LAPTPKPQIPNPQSPIPIEIYMNIYKNDLKKQFK